jgi:hypothetical protein
MNCLAKHLPTIDSKDFECPRCHAKIGIWHIDEGHDFDCEELVAGDNLVCDDCGHGESAGTFSRRLIKARGLKTCPTCKGKGLV